MTTTKIDQFGRVLIPKSIRTDLGLRPGAELVIEDGENEIVLRPVDDDVPLKDEDGILVFTGKATGDLTETLRIQRDERLRKVGGQVKR